MKRHSFVFFSLKIFVNFTHISHNYSSFFNCSIHTVSLYNSVDLLICSILHGQLTCLHSFWWYKQCDCEYFVQIFWCMCAHISLICNKIVIHLLRTRVCTSSVLLDNAKLVSKDTVQVFTCISSNKDSFCL